MRKVRLNPPRQTLTGWRHYRYFGWRPQLQVEVARRHRKRTSVPYGKEPRCSWRVEITVGDVCNGWNKPRISQVGWWISGTKTKPCSSQISITRCRSNLSLKVSSLSLNSIACPLWGTMRTCLAATDDSVIIYLNRLNTYLTNSWAIAQWSLPLLPSFQKIQW